MERRIVAQNVQKEERHNSKPKKGKGNESLCRSLYKMKNNEQNQTDDWIVQKKVVYS